MREEFFTRLKQGFEGVWEAEGGSKWQKYCNNREEEEKEEGGEIWTLINMGEKAKGGDSFI